MSKLRIQQYMEKHKLTPLFEELMNKVLHDQPDDPLVYLIRCLYKKAALQVPKDLKSGTLRRGSPERAGKRSKSPDKAVTTQAWAVASGPELVDRSYEKPWLAGARKTKSREEDRSSSPTRHGHKQKQGWVSDTKVTATTFDDLFEEDLHRQPASGMKPGREGSDIKKAWSRNVGLEDGEDVNFRSRGYRGPRHVQAGEEDPLAGEIMLAKEETTSSAPTKVSRKHKDARSDARRHRQELEKVLTGSPSARSDSSLDSGLGGNRSDTEDDAIELLEDPEDLRREGVTNISKSGYRLSKILRHRQEEANVKLNINLFASNIARYGDPDNKYGDYYESDLERPPTGMSFASNRHSEFSPELSEDEEFESVSQVVGPRKPVWSAPDSDGEMKRPELSQTLPDRSAKHKQAGFRATMPVSFEDPGRPPFQKSLDTDIFLQANRGHPYPVIDKEAPPQVRDSARSLRSLDGAGGWNIPDEPDGSLFTEVSAAPTSARTSRGPPKAY